MTPQNHEKSRLVKIHPHPGLILKSSLKNEHDTTNKPASPRCNISMDMFEFVPSDRLKSKNQSKKNSNSKYQKIDIKSIPTRNTASQSLIRKTEKVALKTNSNSRIYVSPGWSIPRDSFVDEAHANAFAIRMDLKNKRIRARPIDRFDKLPCDEIRVILSYNDFTKHNPDTFIIQAPQLDYYNQSKTLTDGFKDFVEHLQNQMKDYRFQEYNLDLKSSELKNQISHKEIVSLTLFWSFIIIAVRLGYPGSIDIAPNESFVGIWFRNTLTYFGVFAFIFAIVFSACRKFREKIFA